MARLKAALIREYEDNDQVHIEVHNPRNTEAVTLNFRGEKLAKVIKIQCFSAFVVSVNAAFARIQISFVHV